MTTTTTLPKGKTIQTKTPEQFHQLRSKGIGASEISAILGIDPYMTPFKLWQKKTGRLDRDPDNMFTRAGHKLENAVAEYFEEETGNHVIKKTAGTYAVFHPVYDFIFCHPDREYFLQGTKKRGVLECKTTQKKIDKDAAPETWLCQMMYQIGILGYDIGSFAWLERGLVFDYLEYMANYELYDFMIERAGEFWTNNVLKDIPPDPIRSSDIEALYEKSAAGKAMQASDEMLDVYSRMVDVKRTIKALESEYDNLAENVKLALADAEIVVSGEDTLFTWKSHTANRLDQKKLKAEFPDIAGTCMTESNYRSFLIKGV